MWVQLPRTMRALDRDPGFESRPHTVASTRSGWHTTRITGVGIAGAGIVLEPARLFLGVRGGSCLTSA